MSVFYQSHENLINYLDSFMFGAGIPGAVIIVVTTMTIITAMKIRQAAEWRGRTSSASGSSSSSSSSSISPREIALTKMLIGSSVLFHRVRFSPRLVPCGLAVSAGDERWTSPPEPLPGRSMVPGAILLRELDVHHLRVLHHGNSLQRNVSVIVQKEDGGQS